MKIYSSIVFILSGIIGSVLVTPLASANGLGGQRLEKNVGQYIVDIGTDQEFTPQAGAPVRFDFNLLKGSTREPVSFTDVDIYISQNGKPLMGSDIIPARFGPTQIVYTFSENGSYNLETTFFNRDERIANANFPLTIGGTAANSGGGSANGSSRYFIFGFILGTFMGIIIGIIAPRFFQPRKPF